MPKVLLLKTLTEHIASTFQNYSLDKKFYFMNWVSEMDIIILKAHRSKLHVLSFPLFTLLLQYENLNFRDFKILYADVQFLFSVVNISGIPSHTFQGILTQMPITRTDNTKF